MASRRTLRPFALLACGVLSALVSAGIAGAADFRSIGDRPAILYDAPAAKATKVGILGGSQPVEVVVKLDKWSKVRDFSGELAWVENSALADRRLVVVGASNAEVRTQPRAAAPPAFEARRGVVLELTGVPVDGFAPVRHRDGSTGFVAIGQLWGL
ncbi:MAG: SH3 domain-containing protein [Burkholderiales bacterium]|nr:SH3 domain-containing protein [Burkholderiales bacterium]